MRHSVLVIEDLPGIQRLVQVCLSAAGLDVTTRGDGFTGLQAALGHPPDLVVLDIGLPRVDGWEVLRRLRADESTKDVPVLVLTAHGTDENRERAAESGANAFMPKPFRPDALRLMTLSLLTKTPTNDGSAPVSITDSATDA